MTRRREMRADSGTGRRKSSRPEPQVLIAPLIDIVFLLLIFFMLVTKFLNPGIAVALPESGSSVAIESRSVTVTVDSDGKTFLGEDELSFGEITARLMELKAADEIDTVRLKGDREADWQLIIDALDAIRDAGIYDIAIETEPVGAQGESSGDATGGGLP